MSLTAWAGLNMPYRATPVKMSSQRHAISIREHRQEHLPDLGTWKEVIA
jgi:hypothetical protein